MPEIRTVPEAAALTEAERQLALSHEIAMASRGAVLDELLRLVAHEVNQPLAAVVANAGACARWLRREPPDGAEADAALQRVIREARYAGESIRGMQAF